MSSSLTAAVDPPTKGQSSEATHDVGIEDDIYEIQYEEVEEEIEVDEEIEVEEEESDIDDDADFLRELTPDNQIDHQKDTNQVTEPDNYKEHNGTCSVIQGNLASDLKAEGDVGESTTKDCGTDGLNGLGQEFESQLDGKLMSGDLDCVPSFVDNKRRASESSVFSGELHGPIGNMDGSNKVAENDSGCEEEEEEEEESNQMARNDPIVGAPRVRQRSSTPSAEFGDVAKRQPIICDFFAKGWCIKGNFCRFLHVRDSVGVANQHRGEDVAQNGTELVDDEASSLPESNEAKDVVESSKGKGELDNDSSMDLGSDSGREFHNDVQSQYSTPLFKDHSFHGMYSNSPVHPEAQLTAEFSGHLRSDLRREREGEGMTAHHQTVSYRRPLPSEFSSSNVVALGSSPFPGYESENLYGSNKMLDTYRVSGSRVKKPYDWMPSVPFSPSSYITHNLLSSVNQKNLVIEQGSAPWLSKCSYSDHEASVPEEAHVVITDPALVDTLELDHFSNKYANIEPNNMAAEKDESTREAQVLKTAASHWRNNSTLLNKEKLPNPTCVKYLPEGDKTGSNHEMGMPSEEEPRYPTEIVEEIGRRFKKNIECDGDVKVNGHAHKESKVFKYFHVALVEYIKELLKPIWHEGHLSKDAHKMIVRKVVNKVVVTLQPHQIPETSESVKHYLSLSRPKLAKLVEGYANKYRNLEMAA